MVSLPYISTFYERDIPTKARPSQMSPRLLELCDTEIKDLLRKKLICKSHSPQSCAAFYVENAPEKERGAPRLVINYKPLNKVLQSIRYIYPIPNKQDLITRLYHAFIFSKFDLKSGFQQIQVEENDHYKTVFTVQFGHYDWTVMPFGLKNAPLAFQEMMSENFQLDH